MNEEYRTVFLVIIILKNPKERCLNPGNAIGRTENLKKNLKNLRNNVKFQTNFA